jgi:acyl transferase domain-containing protein
MDDANADVGTLSVAIVGMTCRVAGADGVEQFWTNLCDGVESVRDLTDDELIAADVAPKVFTGPDYIRAASVIEGEDLFDAEYFGFGPREAAVMDPQHRVFLEAAAQVLQRAGYQANKGSGDIGVFAASGINQYLVNNVWRHIDIRDALGETQINIGNEADYLATRVAHKLDLHGPAVTVQTACSSSLVAVHLAIQALLAGDCDLAIAGGVSIRTPQRVGHRAGEANIGTADGHCRPFDWRASGTLTGNGVAVVLLKRAAEAIGDGDVIHAMIRGSAVNNDGGQKVGYTAPSVAGQYRVVRSAMAAAGVDPRSIGYVEAHGTATRLGDPIEVTALVKAYGGPAVAPWCALASVKGNLGHLDAAAGAVGLIKAALAVEHGVIPSALHFERPNPELPLAGSPFFVPVELAQWPIDGVRRAGVSSFGIGGTNAHVIVQQPPVRRPSEDASGPQTLVLSGRTVEALTRGAGELGEFLKTNPDVSLADAAYTLQLGRPALAHRAVVICRDIAEARIRLDAIAGGKGRGTAAERRQVAWIFPGQGSQFPGMTAGLYQSDAVFRGLIHDGADAVRARTGLDVLGAFTGAIDAADLARTELGQPALFLAEYALAELLQRRGVPCAAMFGHSLGDFVAACRAGIMSYPDASAIVAERGRIMASCPPGAMLSVAEDAAVVAPLLPDDVVVAAYNAPGTCVVAGSVAVIAHTAELFAGEGIRTKSLRTSHAFHSPLMDQAVERFRKVMSEIRLAAPTEPVVSSMTGTWLSDEEATDPEFWAWQLRRPVRFNAGLATLTERGVNGFVEVGPGRTLSQLVMLASPAAMAISVLPDRDTERDDERAVAAAIGRLWTSGVDIGWERSYRGVTRNRVILPTYPFARTRHWLEPVPAPPALAQCPTRVAWVGEGSAADRVVTESTVLVYDAEPELAPALRERATSVHSVIDHQMLREASSPLTVIYTWAQSSSRIADGVGRLSALIDELERLTMPVRLVVLADVFAPESADRPKAAAPAIRGLVARAGAAPHILSRIVDVPANVLVAETAWVAAECLVADDAAVALRGRRRWRRQLVASAAERGAVAGAWLVIPNSAAGDRLSGVPALSDGDAVPEGVIWMPDLSIPGVRIDTWRAELRELTSIEAPRRAVVLTVDDTRRDEVISAEVISALVDEMRAADGPQWTIVTTGPGGPADADWLRDVVAGVEALVVAGRERAPESGRQDADRPQEKDDQGAGSVRDRVTAIWRLMLGVTDIADDDDFYELGGHSLLATRITARIRQELHVNIPMGELFSSMTTIDAMVECVLRHRSLEHTAGMPQLRRGEAAEPSPLAPVQQPMWFLQQVDPGSAVYLLANNVSLTGVLDVAALRRALTVLARRHDILLSTFAMRDRTPTIASTADDIPCPLVDLSHLAAPTATVEIGRWQRYNVTTPMNINTVPPLRAMLIRLSQERHVLLLGLHHIAGDYWSTAILLDELLELYRADVAGEEPAVPRLEFGYRDYARWQWEMMDGGWLNDQIHFWRSCLTPFPAPLTLPTESSAVTTRLFQGDSVHVEIPDATRHAVERAGRATSTTPFMVFQAALVALLQRIAACDDICVGTFVANRPHPEVEKLVGLFANTVVLRTDVSDDPSFRDLLLRTKSICTDAFGRADVPFDRVVKAVGVPRRWGSNPLFRVMLVAETAPPPKLSVPGLDVSVDAEPSPTAKNDLLFVVYPEGDRLLLQLEFNTDLFGREMARRLADQLLSIVAHGTEALDTRLSRLVTAAEVAVAVE